MGSRLRFAMRARKNSEFHQTAPLKRLRIRQLRLVSAVMMSERFSEGWVWFTTMRKAHYMRDGRSLCGKWNSRGAFPHHEVRRHSADDCKTCTRKLG